MVKRPKTIIRAKQFEDFERTVIDWNKLCDSAVNADSITSFRTEISKSEYTVHVIY